MQVAKVSNKTDLNIPDRVTNYLDSIDTDITTLFLAMQGRIAFGSGGDGVRGENISGEFQVVTDTGSADTEFTVTHNLGAVPIGYIVMKNSKSGNVYSGTTAWTSSTIYLKHSSANANITIFLIK